MPKDIVLCSDGAGHSISRGSNLARVYEALDLYGNRVDPAPRPPLALHDDASAVPLRVIRSLGFDFGWGLARRVRTLYAALCRRYQPGDAIYLLGFERGAATVRALARLIEECGVIDRSHWQTDAALRRLVREAYATHRWEHEPRLVQRFRRALGLGPATTVTRKFRLERGVQHDTLAPGGQVPIRLLGMWDTGGGRGFHCRVRRAYPRWALAEMRRAWGG